MKKTNRIISTVVLFCFILNTLAFGQTINYTHNSDKLAAALLSDDITGIQNEDIGKIKIGLETQLMVGLPTLQYPFKDNIVSNHSDIQYFFQNPKEISGRTAIMVRVKDSHGVRTYYAVFSKEKDANGGFPIDVYSEKEYREFEKSEALKVPALGGGMSEADLIKYVQENSASEIVGYLVRTGLVDTQRPIIEKALSNNPKKLEEFRGLLVANRGYTSGISLDAAAFKNNSALKIPYEINTPNGVIKRPKGFLGAYPDANIVKDNHTDSIVIRYHGYSNYVDADGNALINLLRKRYPGIDASSHRPEIYSVDPTGQSWVWQVSIRAFGSMGGGMNETDLAKYAQTKTASEIADYLLKTGLSDTQLPIIRKALSKDPEKLKEVKRLLVEPVLSNYFAKLRDFLKTNKYKPEIITTFPEDWRAIDRIAAGRASLTLFDDAIVYKRASWPRNVAVYLYKDRVGTEYSGKTITSDGRVVGTGTCCNSIKMANVLERVAFGLKDDEIYLILPKEVFHFIEFPQDGVRSFNILREGDKLPDGLKVFKLDLASIQAPKRGENSKNTKAPNLIPNEYEQTKVVDRFEIKVRKPSTLPGKGIGEIIRNHCEIYDIRGDKKKPIFECDIDQTWEMDIPYSERMFIGQIDGDWWFQISESFINVNLSELVASPKDKSRTKSGKSPAAKKAGRPVEPGKNPDDAKKLLAADGRLHKPDGFTLQEYCDIFFDRSIDLFPEYTVKVRISPDTARADLDALEKDGIVRIDRSDKAFRYYYIVPAPIQAQAAETVLAQEEIIFTGYAKDGHGYLAAREGISLSELVDYITTRPAFQKFNFSIKVGKADASNYMELMAAQIKYDTSVSVTIEGLPIEGSREAAEALLGVLTTALTADFESADDWEKYKPQVDAITGLITPVQAQKNTGSMPYMGGGTNGNGWNNFVKDNKNNPDEIVKKIVETGLYCNALPTIETLNREGISESKFMEALACDIAGLPAALYSDAVKETIDSLNLDKRDRERNNGALADAFEKLLESAQLDASGESAELAKDLTASAATLDSSVATSVAEASAVMSVPRNKIAAPEEIANTLTLDDLKELYEFCHTPKDAISYEVKRRSYEDLVSSYADKIRLPNADELLEFFASGRIVAITDAIHSKERAARGASPAKLAATMMSQGDLLGVPLGLKLKENELIEVRSVMGTVLASLNDSSPMSGLNSELSMVKSLNVLFAVRSEFQTLLNSEQTEEGLPDIAEKTGKILDLINKRISELSSAESELGKILKRLPNEWLEGWLSSSAFAVALQKAGFTQDLIRSDDKSTLIFSQLATFGEYKDGQYEEGMGVLLPTLARRGVKVAVVATTQRQKDLIDELNKDIPEGNRIVYGENIAEARAKALSAKYYYFKVASEPDAGLAGVESITIIVKRILEAIGKVVGITDNKLIDQMHEAARMFAIAA